MKQYIFLLLAIICEVAWASLLKSTEQFTKLIPSIFTILTYIGALVFLSLAVRTMTVGIAYAIWAGLGMIFIAILGVVIYKQNLDFPAIIGLILILLGVIIINVFSKTVSHG